MRYTYEKYVNLKQQKHTQERSQKSVRSTDCSQRYYGERQGAIGGGVSEQPASQRGAPLRQNRLWDGITRLIVVNINKYVVRNYWTTLPVDISYRTLYQTQHGQFWSDWAIWSQDVTQNVEKTWSSWAKMTWSAMVNISKVRATHETCNILLESSLKMLLEYWNEILIQRLNREILRNKCTVPYASEAQFFPPELIKLITKEFGYNNQILWQALPCHRGSTQPYFNHLQHFWPSLYWLGRWVSLQYGQNCLSLYRSIFQNWSRKRYK